MDQTDWLEIKELVRGAEQALISGTLNEWQHASTTTFHVLATGLLALLDRVERLEDEASEPVVDWPDEDYDDGK